MLSVILTFTERIIIIIQLVFQVKDLIVHRSQHEQLLINYFIMSLYVNMTIGLFGHFFNCLFYFAGILSGVTLTSNLTTTV